MAPAKPQFPQSPPGRQLAWLLERVGREGSDVADGDRERFVPGSRILREADGVAGFFRRLAMRLGPARVESARADSERQASAWLAADDGKRWRLSCEVEGDPPHRISGVDWQRELDFDVVVREATEGDGPALAEIERGCPLVLGDGQMVIDRGSDYFAFARLMEDVTVSFGLIDGEPAGINCGALRTARIGGVDRRIMVAIHTRILPQHQRKGLWGALSRLLGKKYPDVDGSIGYGSVDNLAIQRGFAAVAEKWDPGPVRLQLDCGTLAGPAVGRAATPEDAPRIVEILNACHEGEEMYTPYTTTTLRERLERAPAQYSWGHVRLTAGAVVGVWPAGESICIVAETQGERVESRRGVVLDYGFVPGRTGAEEELAALLRDACARLCERGMDTLSLFSSPGSRGYADLSALATEAEAFYAWTPGVPVPDDVARVGMYTDAIYF